MSPIEPPPPNQPPPPGNGGYGSQPPSPGGYGSQPPSGGADAGAAFSWAWKKFTENAATLIVAVLVIIAAAVATAVVVGLIVGAAIYGSNSDGLMGGEGVSAGANFFGTLIITLPVITVAYLLSSGLVRATLAIADGQKPEISQALTPHNPPKTIVYALIVGTISAVLSAVLGLIPFFGGVLDLAASLVVGVLLSFGLYFLVDKNLEPIDAIKASIDLVTKNVGPAIIFYLLAVLAAFLGFLACCIGILVGAPVAALIYTFGYRKLTGGQIVA